MNDPRFLAQIAHALGAYSVVLTAEYFGGHKICILFAALFVIYAAVKEFWYDANFELPKQTTFDNVLDFTFYMVGIVVCLGVIFGIKSHI